MTMVHQFLSDTFYPARHWCRAEKGTSIRQTHYAPQSSSCLCVENTTTCPLLPPKVVSKNTKSHIKMKGKQKSSKTHHPSSKATHSTPSSLPPSISPEAATTHSPSRPPHQRHYSLQQPPTDSWDHFPSAPSSPRCSPQTSGAWDTRPTWPRSQVRHAVWLQLLPARRKSNRGCCRR